MDVSGGAKCDESFRSAVDRLVGGEGSKQKLGAVLITGEEGKGEAMMALLHRVLRERFCQCGSCGHVLGTRIYARRGVRGS